jgi:hypothetical protein
VLVPHGTLLPLIGLPVVVKSHLTRAQWGHGG